MKGGGLQQLCECRLDGVELRVRVAALEKLFAEIVRPLSSPERFRSVQALRVSYTGARTNAAVPPGLKATPATYSCSEVSMI